VWANKFVAPVRAQHRLLFDRAIDRGEIAATIDVDVAMDLLFGPAYHRLLQAHLALDDEFAVTIVNTILDGLSSAPNEGSNR
jgi:hypothetical protein